MAEHLDITLKIDVIGAAEAPEAERRALAGVLCRVQDWLRAALPSHQVLGYYEAGDYEQDCNAETFANALLATLDRARRSL
jgi:hypothetical protein